MYPACTTSFYTLSCQSQMTEKEEDSSTMPQLPAWPGCLTRCLSLNDGSYSAYKQGKNLLVLCDMQTDCHKMEKALVANAGGKNKTTKRIQTTKRIPDHHSHLLLSEYQAWWPTSLSGPLPKRPPIPHSWQHRTWKHRPGILLMLGRHKVTMRAAVLKYDTTFQRGEL